MSKVQRIYPAVPSLHTTAATTSKLQGLYPALSSTCSYTKLYHPALKPPHQRLPPPRPRFQSSAPYPPNSPFRLQVLSDLRLSSPSYIPSYISSSLAKHLPLLAPNLCLLGDIGLARGAALFTFLQGLLERSPSLRIFYIPGNRESSSLTYPDALCHLAAFEEKANAMFGPRFFLMARRRVDIDLDIDINDIDVEDGEGEKITLLGCSLWGRIPAAAAQSARARKLAGFHPEVGIRGQRNAAFERDLAWLNGEVGRIEQEEEPGREVVVLTHHCPTVDSRAGDPRFWKGGVREAREAFGPDLRGERCWESPKVGAWACGHAHWSGGFEKGKRLQLNCAKGFAYPRGLGMWEVPMLVIQRGDCGWQISRQ